MDEVGHANRTFAQWYPGEPAKRQPVHTVYGGAQLFRADTAVRLGQLAERSLDAFAPDPESFGRVLELPLSLRSLGALDDGCRLRLSGNAVRALPTMATLHALRVWALPA